MVYDEVLSYRKFLEDRYSKQTARTYSVRLAELLVGQPVNNTSNRLDVTKIIDKLEEVRYKNTFSQYKNAFFKFCQFKEIILDERFLKTLELLGKKKRKKYRRLLEVDYVLLDKSIKHIKNKKLKLSYQVMLNTGLRVSEVSSITTNTTTIEDDKITFSFIGKGGNIETTSILKDSNNKLYNDLIELIRNTKADTKVFYSSVYLQRKAKKYNFKCLDLRRTFAKLEYKKCKSKKDVQEKLRHKSRKNTNIYLRSRIKNIKI